MEFTDRTTGLSSITTLIVNDSFIVRQINAEDTETQNLTVVNPITVNGLTSTEHVSIETGKNLTVGGTTTTNGLTSNEDVSIGTGKNLTVGGTTTTNGLTSNEDVSIGTGKNLTIGGNVTIQGTMTVPKLSQTSNQVAIGNGAGSTNQGTNSVAIGANAGNANQPNGSIVMNASGEILNGIEQNACYIRPVRSVTTGTGQTGHLYYSTSTRECTTSSNVRQFDVSAAIASGSNCIGEVRGSQGSASGQSSGVNISTCSITLTTGLWQIIAKVSINGATAFTVSVSPTISNVQGSMNSTQTFFNTTANDSRVSSVPILYQVTGASEVFSAVTFIISPTGSNYSLSQTIQAVRFA